MALRWRITLAVVAIMFALGILFLFFPVSGSHG